MQDDIHLRALILAVIAQIEATIAASKVVRRRSRRTCELADRALRRQQ